MQASSGDATARICEGPSPRLSETLDVAAGGTLFVDLDCGEVRVESHEAPQVVVSAEGEGLLGSEVLFTLSREGDDVLVEGDVDGALSWLACARRVRVRARVPRDWSVDVRTRGGRVRLRDIGGRAAAETSGDEIDLRGCAGSALLRSSGGPLWIERVEGDLRATTSGGPIGVRDAGGEVDAHTSGGPIDVRLRAGAGARLDAETSGGFVRVDATLTSGTRSPWRVLGEIRGGGPLVRLRTSGGWIRVRGDER
jgi:hypothetical protein